MKSHFFRFQHGKFIEQKYHLKYIDYAKNTSNTKANNIKCSWKNRENVPGSDILVVSKLFVQYHVIFLVYYLKYKSNRITVKTKPVSIWWAISSQTEIFINQILVISDGSTCFKPSIATHSTNQKRLVHHIYHH